MLKNTHIATTQAIIGASLLLTHQTALAISLPVLIGSHFGSILPDIDQEKSDISQKFPWLSKEISSTLQHRTLTHSFLGLITCAFVSFLLTIFLPTILTVLSFHSLPHSYQIAFYFSIGLFAGYFIHLLADSFSRQGILWFWPLEHFQVSSHGNPYKPGHYSPFFYQVGGPFEKFWLHLMQIVVLIEYLRLFSQWLS